MNKIHHNIELSFFGYLYILDLITTSVSVKQSHVHINSAYVNVAVCVNQNSGPIKVSQ